MGGGWVFVLDDIFYKCLWYSLLTTGYVNARCALMLDALSTGKEFLGIIHF